MQIKGSRLQGTVIRDSGIVTNGLLSWLDATDYSGSGSTWTADTGNDATLYNTPTYSATSPGYFSFSPASFEYAAVSDLGDQNTWTVEAWFRVTASMTGQITSVVCNEFDLVNKLNFSLGTNNAPGSYNICAGFFDGAWHSTSGFAPTQNVWYHVVGTYDGSTIRQYVGAVLDTQLSYSGTPQSGGEVRIARRWDSPDNDSVNFFPGDIAIVRVYSTALSATEISQNYAAERTRFGQ